MAQRKHAPPLPVKDKDEKIEKVAELLNAYLKSSEGQDRIGNLAKLSGVSKSTIYRILATEVMPTQETCLALEQAMGLTAKQLQVAAGYVVLELDTDQILPQLKDPRLGLYLSAFDRFSEETQENILSLLETAYARLQRQGETASVRPDFARPANFSSTPEKTQE